MFILHLIRSNSNNGRLRTASYLYYSENVGEANKKVFCKIQKLVQPSSTNTIIGHFEYYIFFFLITSIQSIFIIFKQKKYLTLVSGEVVKSPSKCLKFNFGTTLDHFSIISKDLTDGKQEDKH